MEFDADKLAYCGIYCPECSFVAAYETGKREHLLAMPERYDEYKQATLSEVGNCPGCKLDNLCGDCDIKDCARSQGQQSMAPKKEDIDSCAECAKFPCEKVLAFGNDGVPHHRQALENLMTISAIGKESWFEGFRKNLECDCGERLSWYYKCPIHRTSSE